MPGVGATETGKAQTEYLAVRQGRCGVVGLLHKHPKGEAKVRWNAAPKRVKAP